MRTPWARLRSALWPIPAAAVLLAVVAGVALPAFDRAIERSGGDPLAFVFGGGPAAARDVLAAIAGSLISVTGLVFSLTVVALQLASSQYSPRVLQTFGTDRAVQFTLAQLTATFVYALTVLRSVRTESATADEAGAFVPRLSITVAYLLTLGSVLALLLFLGHLAQLLRVETTLRDVHDEAHETLVRELPDPGGRLDRDVVLPGGPGIPLSAASSGFLVGLAEDRLVTAAAQAGAVVLLGARFGDSVVSGVPVATAWPGRSGDDLDLPRLQQGLEEALQLHFERLPERDAAYGLRKIVDIAVRALSPGTNDPTTAVHALSHVSAVLGDLLEHPLAPAGFRDDGVLRLVTTPWSAGDLLVLAVEEPVQFAAGQPAVLRRLAALLREVAWRAPAAGLDDALRHQLDLVVATATDSTHVPAEEQRAWRLDLEQALARRWPAQRPGQTDVSG
jgi:uncharacterized membrane protein